MRIAYLDCPTGISGDMTLAALIDAGIDAEAIRKAIASLPLPDVSLNVNSVMRCGFRGLHVEVEHPPQHVHRGMPEIEAILMQSRLTARQQALAWQIFLAIGEAEAFVHNMPLETVHFHEVGAVDSIVDIVGAAVGFDLLNAQRIVCSRLPTGHGSVSIAHGVCPVPAPATAELLKGIPLVDSPVEAELTTPTGAAIAKTVAHSFGRRPEMTIERIGYGAGTRQFSDRPNMLRLLVGTSEISEETDLVCILETSLDDVSPEVIGYTRQSLLAAGALDVYTHSIQMKKGRPGTLVTVLCPLERYGTFEEILFSETSTFGIRRMVVERARRTRREHEVETPWGPIQGKLGWRTGGDAVFVPEFESCAAAARQYSRPLRDIYRAAEAAYLSAPIDVATFAHESPRGPSPQQHPLRAHEHDHSHDHDHRHDHDHGR